MLAVPAKYPSIQAAIDSAVPGDTVLVAPGRYYENIRFKGKGIVVASQFLHSRDAADIERTIIDGSRPAHPDTGTVVRFVNQEDSTAVLEGFTITGGTGTIWLDAKDLQYFREGGGILCELGSPTIRYNHIVNNVATSTAEERRRRQSAQRRRRRDPLWLLGADHHEQRDPRQPRPVRRRGRALPLGRNRQEQPHRRQHRRRRLRRCRTVDRRAA